MISHWGASLFLWGWNLAQILQVIRVQYTPCLCLGFPWVSPNHVLGFMYILFVFLSKEWFNNKIVYYMQMMVRTVFRNISRTVLCQCKSKYQKVINNAQLWCRNYIPIKKILNFNIQYVLFNLDVLQKPAWDRSVVKLQGRAHHRLTTCGGWSKGFTRQACNSHAHATIADSGSYESKQNKRQIYLVR